jgi:ABC-type transport system substrate-binding protein
VLDRYTFQIRVAEPQPRFRAAHGGRRHLARWRARWWRHYGDKIGEHPVGTGPFRLAQWKRSSKIVLERNPGFREVLLRREPAEGDAARQAAAARLKGRRLPLIDRVEVSVIEEVQPRLAGLPERRQDLIEALPAEFSSIAIPNDQLAPNLRKQGIRMERYPRAGRGGARYFGMENPVVGGYEPHKVALRRAISLARGPGPRDPPRAPQPGHPRPGAHRPGRPTATTRPTSAEMSTYDPARAKALLDLYG